MCFSVQDDNRHVDYLLSLLLVELLVLSALWRLQGLFPKAPKSETSNISLRRRLKSFSGSAESKLRLPERLALALNDIKLRPSACLTSRRGFERSAKSCARSQIISKTKPVPTEACMSMLLPSLS